MKSKSKADCFLPDPVKKPQTQCPPWNVDTDPTCVEMKEHWPLTLQQNILKMVPDRCPDLSLRMQLQKFVFRIVLAWEYWLAKMLSLEKMNPMCTTIYLKRHVKAEEDIFFIASVITKVKQWAVIFFLASMIHYVFGKSNFQRNL